MMVPPTLDALWYRRIGIPMGSGAFLFTMDPSVTSATPGALGTVMTSYLKSNWSALSADLIGANPANTGSFAPTDRARFLTSNYSYRPVTGALRITVRYPMTSAPGRLFAVLLSAADSTLAAMSYDDVVALDSARPITFDGSGVATIQVNYKPQSLTDLSVRYSENTLTAPTISTKLVIVGVGWTSPNVDVESIVHTEGLNGALPGSISGENYPSLSLTTSVEQLAAMVREVPVVLNRNAIQACTLSQITRYVRRYVPSAPAEASESKPSIPRETRQLKEDSNVNVESSGPGAAQGFMDALHERMPSRYTVGATTATGLLVAAERYARHGNLIQN